eukprot:193478-Hanusia_phi.AAC.1
MTSEQDPHVGLRKGKPKLMSLSFTFAKFLDKKMEAAFRNDLDSDTWLEGKDAVHVHQHD